MKTKAELKRRFELKQLLYIAIGIVLIAIGIHFFLLPNRLSLGGAAGISIVLSKYIPLPTGALLVIINAVLFVIGFALIGGEFGTKTVISSLALSLLVWALEIVYPIKTPVIDGYLINIILATLVYGTGVGMVLNNYASTGGSDIFAKIFNKYFGLDLGKGCQLTDFVIVCLSGFAYGKEIAIYSLVGVILNGIIIDTTIDGLNTSKLCIINTSKTEEVCRFLIEKLTRSANVYRAVGAYTKQEKEVIQTVVSNRDFVYLKKYIQSIDPAAFIIVTNASETFGWHWRKMDG